MRKLASIKVIEEINPIEGADAIDLASIGGWNVVVKKGEHLPGDKIVYFEIDSFIPEHLAPFLGGGKPATTYEGIQGFRLKSKKMRGALSQGLILTLKDCQIFENLPEDFDLTDRLGIKKYEKPLPRGSNNCSPKGNFPSFIPKTDQERIQNLKRDFESYKAMNLSFEVTEKLDGTSCTFYSKDGVFGVCSRNFDLEFDGSNFYWQMFEKYKIKEIFESIQGRNFAIQGEIIGEGIQGDQYQLKDKQFFVFDIYDIDSKNYLNSKDRLKFCEKNKLQHAPVISYSQTLQGDMRDILDLADGQSLLNNSLREGLVFKCLADTTKTFKAISNKWLLKNE